MTGDPFKRLIWFLVLLAVWLALDLYSKQYVFDHVVPEILQSLTIIDGYVSFTHVRNEGAVWGMFQDLETVLFVFNLILTPALFLFFLYSILQPGFLVARCNVYFVSALGLIMAGALGNLVDRIVFGYVRDFINVTIPVIRYNWPVFNVADAGITVGACVLAVQMLVNAPKPDEEDGGTDEN